MANTAKKLPEQQIQRPMAARDSSLQNSGHYAATLQHEAKEGVTIDDLLNPAYWEHVSSRLKRDDRVDCFNSSFFAQLVVVESSTGGGARLAVLSSIEKQPSAEKLASFYDAFRKEEQRDGTWSIFRNDPDGSKLIESGLNSEGKAQMRLESLINVYR